MVGEGRLDDVDDGLVVEDAAVRGLAEQPQPRPQRHLVDVEVVAHAHPFGVDEHAVVMALGRVGRLGRNDARLAERGVEVDVGGRAQRLDVDLEQLGKALERGEPRQRQLLVAQRRPQPRRALGLIQHVGLPLAPETPPPRRGRGACAGEPKRIAGA